MEVRTYIAGMASGWEGAFKSLDRQTREDLGTRIEIHSVTDTLYRRNDLSHTPGGIEDDDKIARVVVYSQPEESE